MIRAFEHARAAAPEAVLFLNDYNLENIPAKRATFLRLVERLLKAGAPLTGLGTQTHLDIDLPAGQAAAVIRELARFGLPIHVSELDVSLRTGDRLLDLRPRAQKIEQQTARVAEVAEAFMALPRAQRFAFTVWGLRDADCWLRRRERPRHPAAVRRRGPGQSDVPRGGGGVRRVARRFPPHSMGRSTPRSRTVGCAQGYEASPHQAATNANIVSRRAR